MPISPNNRKDKTSKLRVGVLRGGPSSEYEVSLKTGATVLEHLPSDYHGIDIFIDKKGKWHLSGVICDPQKALKQVDVVFNGLHGEYGEDGTVQRLMEHFKVPYTGSNSFSSALAMNKVFARKIFDKENIKVPRAQVLKKEEANYLRTFEAFSTMEKPLVVKPASAGSSLGVSITNSVETFSEAIEKALEYSPAVLIEEFIPGTEATCAVIEGSDSDYALPPIEIRTNNPFFDYEAKYNGKSEEICPGNFSESISRKIQDTSLSAHRSLGLRHYSRTDMIVTAEGDIYVLEINTLPGLTAESLLPKSLKATKSSLSEFIDHVINLAISKKPH